MSADDKPESISSEEGTRSNTVVNPEAETDKAPPKATTGFFTMGFTEAHRLEDTAAQQEADRKAAEKKSPEGVTILGFTEASRLENTAEQQEAERKAAERSK